MRYQKEVIKSLVAATEHMSDLTEFDYIIKGFVDNYSNRYEKPDGKVLEMWWGCLQKKYIDLVKKHLIISKSALEVLNNYSTIGDYKKLLRIEHMTPMSFTKNKLKELKKNNNITEETVEESFKYANIILLTKDESNILDKNRIETSDVDRFSLFEDATEERNLIGKKLDRTGSGLFRLFYLVYRGIEFTVDGKELTNPLEYYKTKEHKLY